MDLCFSFFPLLLLFLGGPTNIKHIPMGKRSFQDHYASFNCFSTYIGREQWHQSSWSTHSDTHLKTHKHLVSWMAPTCLIFGISWCNAFSFFIYKTSQVRQKICSFTTCSYPCTAYPYTLYSRSARPQLPSSEKKKTHQPLLPTVRDSSPVRPLVVLSRPRPAPETTRRDVWIDLLLHG